ncbi:MULTISPECIES: GNAT family N-acetyltransferase [Sphingobacterium]|uniref:Putative N-acetyltransferase YhbS n=1 Tax=Sphingobacterium siyangense TaxID=459529 RepID=A0A562N056_9SPHI|nr:MULTISPECIES: N-acetyltransferase [Sphingobacterium]TWI25448.1 putative N-acetyltransferase YhbS [Sphingobacterium siyangense]
MNIKIRQEKSSDPTIVFELIRIAFENEQYSDHQEHILVEKLRKRAEFIPQMSIVAEVEGEIVGYILLTKVQIIDKENQKAFDSLALAPVAVLPQFQGQGIGGKLILAAHQIAKELGFGSVVVLGHADYYPKFGYVPASVYGIQFPFDVPDENCMIKELTDNSLKGIQGTVHYPEEFGVI